MSFFWGGEKEPIDIDTCRVSEYDDMRSTDSIWTSFWKIDRIKWIRKQTALEIIKIYNYTFAHILHIHELTY